MNQSALIEDMRQATCSIAAARLPIRLRAAQEGVVVEAAACGDPERLGPLETVVTWAALDEARAPIIQPLVGQLILYLQRGGVLPLAFSLRGASSRPRRPLH